MSNFVIGNFFLGLSILMTAISQVMLKSLLSGLDENTDTPGKFYQLFSASMFWRSGLVGTMIVVAFLFWTISLTKLNLSYAYPIACGSALVVAFLSVVFLGETVTWRVWVGTVFIMAGTVFLAPTN